MSSGWKAQVLKVSADFKKATETGDFSAFVERAKNPKLTGDELKRYANEFPEVKSVVEDAVTYHQGITDEFQSVTDDLESGSADKPTAIERVKAQSDRFKAESLSNTEASTQRVIALIEGLDADQQQRAADYWAESFSVFAAAWSEILTETEGIFETTIEWLSQVWEQVRGHWSKVKAIYTKTWTSLQAQN